MCTNPKLLINNGKYAKTTYKGEKGQEYSIKVFAKCGNCPQCKNEKANNWVIRNYYESQTYDKMCFITLTYKDNPYFLIKRHLQNFFKRLRQKIKCKIRYFAVGEYGTRTNRPHYHIIIYNWIDKNAVFEKYNKKYNKIYYSEIIDKTWGMGLTSYQEFEKHEIPYITLYDTPQESLKRDYIISKENAKKLIKELKENKQSYGHHKLMIQTLKEELKKIDQEKVNYLCIKEFNTWSIALGWDNFYKEFLKHKNTYDWKEYIEDKEFLTPSPWIIKLANMGYDNAIKEMLRRATELESNLTAEELAAKNKSREQDKQKKLKIDWATQKDTTIL